MVIKQKENKGRSQQELAKIFGAGKNTKQKADFLAPYEDHFPNDQKRVGVFHFKVIDLLLFDGFKEPDV